MLKLFSTVIFLFPGIDKIKMRIKRTEANGVYCTRLPSLNRLEVLLKRSLLAEALSFVIPDEKIESLCRFEIDFRIAHILQYPSN